MSRITATLSVLSEQIRPDQMTSILSFTPDHSVLKGIERNPPRPLPKAFGWYVASTQIANSTVDDVLSSLLKRLGTLHRRIRRLYEIDPDLEVRFQISIAPYSEDIVLHFRAKTVSGLSRFGGSLDIEFFEP